MSHSSIGTVTLERGALNESAGDLVILALSKDNLRLPEEVLSVLGREGGPLRALLASGDFKGELGETALVYGVPGPFARVLLVGLGSAKDVTRERIRSAAASAVRRARDLGLAKVCFRLPLAEGIEPGLEAQVELVTEGLLLGTYQFAEFRTLELEKLKSIGTVALLVPPAAEPASAAAALRAGEVRARAVNLARDLGNTPANFLTPTHLAQKAEAIARESGLQCEILERADCEKLGMGAFLSVARGSEEPPKFIVLRYDCGKQEAPLIGLVGKGITFDSGGISLKPGAKMDEMKFDMCGAAAVLATMQCLRPLSIPVNVVAVVPATENLPSGRATKPGDVVTSYSGKTIEILNTDAEGRLILADGLSYVVKNYKPAAVIDLATLTGAVLIALGHYGAAVLSNDDGLAARIQSAAGSSGDRTWRLPIWEEYPEPLKGDTGDLKNIGDGSAGTIVGGAFLKEFIGETPWAHIDIAGTAWWDKDRPHLPKGPSGYGVRLLLDLLQGYGH